MLQQLQNKLFSKKAKWAMWGCIKRFQLANNNAIKNYGLIWKFIVSKSYFIVVCLSGLLRRILPHGINFRFSFVGQGLTFLYKIILKQA